MQKLEPIALTVDGDDAYKVRFQTDDGEVEYPFTFDRSEFTLLVSDDAFLNITGGDPGADCVKRAICYFHGASTQKLKPIAIKVDGDDAYKVRFQTDTGDAEYRFTFKNGLTPLLVSDDEFLRITTGESGADALKRSICFFHDARNSHIEDYYEAQ